ncbi:O-antigen polymerase [Desemzia sp. FAM 24101]|uniref:O-antigen polymerase n=1 Tax=Desemzia sp. FAM 24101 TaxID=3259522 RepID=UPI00389028A2
MLLIVVKKRASLGIVLIGQYFLISLFSVILLKENYMHFQQINLAPYLLLLVSYIITFFPFLDLKNEFKVTKLNVKYYRIYNYFVYLYIFFAVVVITMDLPSFLETIMSGEWSEQRNLYYDEKIVLYDNLLERIALNYLVYFRLICLIIYFLFLKNDYKPRTRSLLLISIIIPLILTSIATASRGTIYQFFLLFFAFILFFSKAISKKQLRKIKIFIVILGSIFLIFALSVTIDRFSSSTSLDKSSLSSIIEYLGQSPLIFNERVFPINSHTLGTYSFGNLLEWFGVNIQYPQSTIGGSWGAGFYTYVGIPYIDFGIIGVIIHSILLNFVITYLMRKRKLKLRHFFMIFYVYEYLLKGSFVIGRSQIISVVINLIIYFCLYAIDKIKVNNKNKNYIEL